MSEKQSKSLVSDIKNQIKELSLLLKVIEEEKDALTKDEMSLLSGIIERKNAQVKIIGDLSEEIEKKYGVIKTEEVTDKALLTAITDIQSISSKVWDEQETNILLIQQSLSYNNMMMENIQNVIKKAGNYGKTGNIESKPIKTKIDESV